MSITAMSTLTPRVRCLRRSSSEGRRCADARHRSEEEIAEQGIGGEPLCAFDLDGWERVERLGLTSRVLNEIEDAPPGREFEAVAAKVKDMTKCVFCIHVPPYDSQLDLAPLTDENLKVVSKGGRPQMIPVGSKAVRRLIEKYQPLVALHGHIHESPGFVHIGKTECLNPGSEYGEGVFKGYLVEIEGDKITKLQRVEA